MHNLREQEMESGLASSFRGRGCGSGSAGSHFPGSGPRAGDSDPAARVSGPGCRQPASSPPAFPAAGGGRAKAPSYLVQGNSGSLCVDPGLARHPGNICMFAK